MAGKLTFDKAGKMWGPASITHNDPFPTRNGSWGSGAMMGVIMHTEVGYDHNVVEEFNNPGAGASATFSIDTDGHIHQYGPVGLGWYAWAQVAGNRMWYSIEHEDKGNPNNPLTLAQMVASAQIVEALSAFAGFPLQVSNSTTTKGYGVHNMGGTAWGGHTCPDEPPNHVRSSQRPAILSIAREIRAGVHADVRHKANGKLSLDQMAKLLNTDTQHVINVTRHHDGITKAHLQMFNKYCECNGTSAPMPQGLVFFSHPVANS